MNNEDLIKFSIDTLKTYPEYADVDMSESSAFYNLVILPFSLLVKPVFDLNNNTLNSQKLDQKTESQLDDFASMFFVSRRTENLITLEVSIYLTNTANPTEPLVILTTDEFKTSQNQVFYPIQDYIFEYNSLPLDSTNQYKVATIVTSSLEKYPQILENTIKTSSLLHPLLSFVTNSKASSSPIEKESNEDFIKTIQKSLAQRNNITGDSLYTNLRLAYPQITDCLSIGYGDPEMQRDIAVAAKDWSGHFGGMTDIYIKTSLTPSTINIVGSKNSTNDGYKFTIRKYKGYDWLAQDTANPSPQSLTPWIKIDSVNPLPTMPIILIDWDNTSIQSKVITYENGVYPKYKIDVLPDPLEKSYGKNYRYSIYENLEITIYTETALTDTANINFSYYTLSNIEDIQNYINNSANRVLCSNNLIKSFIPIEILDLIIVYDSRYYVDQEFWRTKIANIINSWSLEEPIRFSTLFKDFPAPIRIEEAWHDGNNLPYTLDANGMVTGLNDPLNTQNGFPTFAMMNMNHIDGSHNLYLSTRHLYPLVKNGLSSSYRTCRYFIIPENITFQSRSW